MSRSAYAVLSSSNLRHNLGVLRQHAPHAQIIAMIKANAYGHGLRSVGKRLQEAGVDFLGVAAIDEAQALRQAGVACPIILMEGVFEPSEFLIAAAQGFQVIIHTLDQAEWLLRAQLPLPVIVWIKVHTGMYRLGVPLNDVPGLYAQLSASPDVAPPVRIMGHFACADNPDHPLNTQQLAASEQLLSLLPPEARQHTSLCNSAALLTMPSAHYTYVRSGLALYGVSPLPDQSAADLGLKPVMTLQSTLIAINQCPQGATVSYGGRYTCPQDMPIGVVAFGYGDGYPFSARDGTPMLIQGIRCPLVGRVSMDMLMVDLTSCPQARIGDAVTLWGKDLPLEEVVAYTSEIPWTMLTSIQNRVKYLWTND